MNKKEKAREFHKQKRLEKELADVQATGETWKQILVDVSKVDWKLLRNQKKEIYRGRIRNTTIPSTVLEGIISFLDDIQDQAAEVLGEKEVFGRMK